MVKKTAPPKTRNVKKAAGSVKEDVLAPNEDSPEVITVESAIPMVEREGEKGLSPVERRWLDTIVEMRDKPTDWATPGTSRAALPWSA